MDVSALIEVKSNPRIPVLNPGDTVRVKTKVVEGDKERIQVFQGVVLKVKQGGMGASFTVRRVAYGIGVERTFPVYSPLVDSVEVVRRGKVRRARLYYLRGLSTKASRIKEKRISKEALALIQEQAQAGAEAPAEVPPTAEAQPQAQAEAQPEAKVEAKPEAQAPTVAPPEAQAEPPKA